MDVMNLCLHVEELLARDGQGFFPFIPLWIRAGSQFRCGNKNATPLQRRGSVLFFAEELFLFLLALLLGGFLLSHVTHPLAEIKWLFMRV